MRHGGGVADPAVAVGERELQRFDEEVLAGGPLRWEGRRVEEAQRLERGDALGGRGQLDDVDVAVRGVERLGPLPRVAGEVVGGHRRAVLGEGGDDLGADRPAVVRVGSVGGERLDGAGQRRLAQPRAGCHVPVHGVPGAVPGGAGRVHAPPLIERPRRGGADREAVTGVADGVGGERREVAGAPAFEEVEPAGDRPGDGHRVGSEDRHVLAVAARRDLLDGGRGG